MKQHTEGGSISLDNLLPMANMALFGSGRANLKEETKEAEGITHIFSHAFILSFELSSVCHPFPSVGLGFPRVHLRSLWLKPPSGVGQFFQNYSLLYLICQQCTSLEHYHGTSPPSAVNTNFICLCHEVKDLMFYSLHILHAFVLKCFYFLLTSS